VTTIVEHIARPAAAAREAVSRGPTTPDAFRRAWNTMRCLDQIEVARPPQDVPPPSGRARIVFWNAERLKYPEPSMSLLERAGADAVLLCEVDLGMARSGNRHTTAEAAAALGAGHVFAVEFVELDLGDARERSWHRGEANEAGLHGAALLSPHVLHRPTLARLETSGRWFDGGFGERRVGGRIAVMAEFNVVGVLVVLVCVHYESHTGPADRLEQTTTLLDAIDRHAPDAPVLIGGDFNTNTFERSEKADSKAAAIAEDPDRLVRPMAYEPMFEALRARGYDWEACNVMDAVTQRTRPDGTPAPPFGRIDWFFARGLACSEPSVIAAVDAAGVAISDHEALAVTIAPSRP
jgi:endonuclease/exonuclease/phosphatase family metal-dependent hydrolase